MAEQNQDTKNEKQNAALETSEVTHDGRELDAAGKSLSEALRISFVILKVIMIVLVFVFLASGLRTVGPDEEALVLRFGKIRGVGEERLLKPGLHWIFPYPIDKIVKIPVAKTVNLAINTFWYYQSDQELVSSTKRQVPPTEPLNPTRDGYCITCSEKQGAGIGGLGGSDYNIVHSKWQLTYQIFDPESFFRNVYVEDVKPGQDYFDVITRSITPLLKAIFDDAVVTAMVHYTIDEALSSQDRIPKHVERLVQQKLTQEIGSGIKVLSVQLTDITWPRQVDRAFQAFITASNKKEETISKARTYAANTLNEAAGPVARKLHATLHDETISEQEKELLWSQAAGAAQAKIAQARAYATKIVENVEADAQYLQKVLPEYREQPEIFIQEIHRDAIMQVLKNAEGRVMIQPVEGAKGKREIRIIVGGKE